MNRLLILLCMAGWALYIVHTNDRGDNLAAQSPKFSEEPSPAAQAPVDSIPSELQPIPATAVQSPHAITPDGMPRQVIANAQLLLRRCSLARVPTRCQRPVKIRHPNRRPIRSQKNNSGSRRKRAYEAAHPIRLN